MKECATSSHAMRTGGKERTRSMIRLGVIDTSVKRKTVIKEITRERRSMVGKRMGVLTMSWCQIEINIYH
ncbi:Uncharacterized protein APZ42_033439 [Daphnia magna]|uniref:Uncharacterized protein n=1 Tax=Daphnia magna TaxID=35525 RepID=A0A164L3B8_9CRUS|nr:Uncharacterized protein APZ42_033439 [Daphnia magna]